MQKFFIIFCLIIVFIILNFACDRDEITEGRYGLATIQGNIVTTAPIDSLILILRGIGKPIDLLSKNTQLSKIMLGLVCDLPQDTVIIKIYNYFGELVRTLTLPNETWDGRDESGRFVSDGIYKFCIEKIEDDSITYMSERYLLWIIEDYNLQVYSQTDYFPVFTYIPQNYNYKIENILTGFTYEEYDSIGNYIGEFIVSSPFKFCCKILSGEEQVKEINLRNSWTEIVNFIFE